MRTRVMSAHSALHGVGDLAPRSDRTGTPLGWTTWANSFGDQADAIAVTDFSRSTLKRPVAKIASACAQELRPHWSGAPRRRWGPATVRICHTVEGATWMPRPASSPWMRR